MWLRGRNAKNVRDEQGICGEIALSMPWRNDRMTEMLILVIENTEGLSMNLNFAAPTQRFFLANSCIGELEDHSYGVILSHGSTTIEVCSFPSKLSVKINISQWQLKVAKLLVRVFKWSCAHRCCTSTVYKLSLHPLNWWRWCPEKKFDFDLERPAVLPRLFGFVRKCLTYLIRTLPVVRFGITFPQEENFH